MVSKDTGVDIANNDSTSHGASQSATAIDPEIEDDNAELAFQEFREKGFSTRRCLRCGGKFLFYDAGCAYRIWCENSDFQVSARGI